MRPVPGVCRDKRSLGPRCFARATWPLAVLRVQGRMRNHGPGLSAAGFLAALVVFASTGVCSAAPADSSTAHTIVRAAPATVELAQTEGTEPRELQPRYEPAPPRPKSSYNDEYIFGLTRGVAESTMHPAVKILIFPITVPLDLALLPFEAIGGLF